MNKKTLHWYGHFFKKDQKPQGWICGTPFLDKVEKDILLGQFEATLKISKFRFRLKLNKDTTLPAYKGMLLQDALAKGLKQISCGLSVKDCPNCSLRRDCVFYQMFEAYEERAKIRNAYFALLPYIIEPLDSKTTEYRAGDFLEFNLVLFGYYHITNVIYAIIEMEQSGISEGRPFELESVTILDEEIYPKSDQKIHTELLDGKSITICDNRLTYYNSLYLNRSCKVKLITPLRFQIGNSLITETPSFWFLIKPILNRFISLSKLYGTSCYIDYKYIQAAAEKVMIASSNVRWVRCEEQDSTMEGLLGEIEYTGDLEPFQSLLAIGEAIHLGQNTAIGFGKIEVEDSPEEYEEEYCDDTN